MQEMRKIFQRSQDSGASHAKLLKQLKKLYDDMDSVGDFIEQFIGLLKQAMLISENHRSVERFFQFFVKFSLSLESNVDKENISSSDEDSETQMNPVLSSVFTFLLQVHSASNNAVRYRSCYLINKILSGLGSGTTISEQLFSKIGKVMLKRIKDKYPLVRTQAVYALSWLQEPVNENCSVIEAYLYHLSRDPHPGVRRAILTVIATNQKTLIPIMDRIRDVKDTIRKTAYLYLADKVCVRILSISQRVRLLSQGLNDRSDNVRKAVEQKLVPVWLKFFDNDVQAFLHSLDIQGSSDLGQQVLKVLFKSQAPVKLIKEFNLLNNNHLIPFEKLTCESAFHWRCLCQYIKSLGGAIAIDGFDDLVPNLTPFCAYIKRYVLDVSANWSIDEKLEHEFISQQLLIIAGEFDLVDQAGRNNLHTLVREILLSTKLNLTLVKPLVTCFRKIKYQKADFVKELVEIISEIREPTTTVETFLKPEQIRNYELQIAKVSVEINILRDSLDSSIETQDFIEAQNIKEKIAALESKKAELQKNMLPVSQEVRVENNDPQILLKCLTISSEMLRREFVKELSPSVQSLMETLIIPGIQNEDPAVRNEAILSLGLCCLLNINAASQHLFLFLQISQVDQEFIRATALKCIFDLLLLFGLDAFHSDEIVPGTELNSVCEDPITRSNNSSQHSQQALSNVMSILSSQLDSDMREVRTVATEGIGKLLFMNRIFSPRLYSRLMLLWFSPITKNDTRLRHFLGVFLPSFAKRGKSNHETMEEAFILTMETLFDAPMSSPLAQIEELGVANFFLQLTNNHFCEQDNIQDSTVHDRLAVKFCNMILKNPGSLSVRSISKILSQLNLTPHSSLVDLATLAKHTLEVVKDKQSLKVLEKFSLFIKQMTQNPSVHYLVPHTNGSSVATDSVCVTPLVEEETGSDIFRELGRSTPITEDETMSEIEQERRCSRPSAIALEMPSTGGTSDLSPQNSLNEVISNSSIITPSLEPLHVTRITLETSRLHCLTGNIPLNSTILSGK